MGYREELQRLQHQFELANRAIPLISDEGTAERLARFADEIKGRLDQLQAVTLCEQTSRPAFEVAPHWEVHMTHVYEDDIRARAYKLWEAAGKPEGRMDEFWYEAERQLKAEQIKHELKTPDTL
ncbi:hypothetical protein ABIB99_007413 [Bradyrhizobium sp. LA6.1]|uniref:DUF2934 domain-containing protein n=1 Tax=Bradyrhizobium sp. LA6.1 TaxID=3156378 RepID=UPI0033911555